MTTQPFNPVLEAGVSRQGKIEALAYLRWLEIWTYNGYNKCLQFAIRTGEVSVRKGGVAIKILTPSG